MQARVQGYINRLYVKSPQQQVKRGQPLADIVAPEWLSASGRVSVAAQRAIRTRQGDTRSRPSASRRPGRA